MAVDVTIRRVGTEHRRVHATDFHHDGARWHIQSFDGSFVLIRLGSSAGACAEMSIPVEVIDLAARLLHLDQPLATTALLRAAGRL